jgi:hypothetical protein
VLKYSDIEVTTASATSVNCIVFYFRCTSRVVYGVGNLQARLTYIWNSAYGCPTYIILLTSLTNTRALGTRWSWYKFHWLCGHKRLSWSEQMKVHSLPKYENGSFLSWELNLGSPRSGLRHFTCLVTSSWNHQRSCYSIHPASFSLSLTCPTRFNPFLLH